MKRKRLIYIAVTMFFALVGLLAVQFYWAKRISAMSREFVHTNMEAAMQEVAAQTEGATPRLFSL